MPLLRSKHIWVTNAVPYPDNLLIGDYKEKNGRRSRRDCER